MAKKIQKYEIMPDNIRMFPFDELKKAIEELKAAIQALDEHSQAEDFAKVACHTLYVGHLLSLFVEWKQSLFPPEQKLLN